MASIVERNNSVSVVYYYEDEDGTKKQKWETVKKDQIDAASVAALTEKRKKERTKSAKRTAASARKTEVEFTQRKGTFIIPKRSRSVSSWWILFLCMESASGAYLLTRSIQA